MKLTSFVSLAALAATLANAGTANAQETNIAPDMAAGVTLGTIVSHSGNTYTIDGGTTAGSNLFHSFTTFDIGAGDVAQWIYSGGNPASITNVVNRITGGTPSSIMGVLDSTAIPNADFYFINPAGIVFSGNDAQVNVPAAAHFSTASELRFADGRTFSVATPSGSTLSVAAPQAFGFLGNEGDISLLNIENLDDTPFVAKAGALGLSGANIFMENAFIGSNELTVTAAGAVPIAVGIDGTTDAPAAGRMELTWSWLQTWAADCFEFCLGAEGFISLNAGELFFDSTGVVADFDSATDPGGVSFVRLIGNNSVEIVDSAILADGYDVAAAGDVYILSGGDVSISDSIVLAYTQGSGEGGTVDIRGANVRVSGGVLGSESVGSGNGGSTYIEAVNQLVLENDAWILTTAWDSGNAGAITLIAPDVLITDSLVSSETYGTGNAGTISIQGGSLEAWNSTISTSTYDGGIGGAVDILVSGSLSMDSSSITSNSFASGAAGDVRVGAGDALLTAGSVISSDGLIDGDAGDVVVTVTGHLDMRDGSRISSSGGEGAEGSSPEELLSSGIGIASSPPPPPPGGTPPDPKPTSGLASAGSVSVTAGLLTMNDFSEIATRSYGSGDAGKITVTVDEMNLLKANIVSDSIGSGDAGDVLITASHASLGWTTISSDAELEGSAGDVSVWIGGPLNMWNSTISSDAGAGLGTSGNAGSVTVTAGDLNMVFSIISATAWSNGMGGEVTVEADRLIMNSARIWSQSIGEGDAGTINVDIAGNLSLFDSDIVSDASGGGDAGDISIKAASAALDFGSTIDSTTSSAGAGGSISFTVDGELKVVDSTVGAGTSHSSTGNGGDVLVFADTLTLDGWSSISTTSYGAGDGGRVGVFANVVSIANNSQISSDAYGTGNAGDIEVNAHTINLTGASAISSDAVSANGGRGGNITLIAEELDVIGGSRVSTSSANNSAAGSIRIFADRLTVSGFDENSGVRSQISSENLSETGGDAGSILIGSAGVTISDGARVSTNSLAGAAGNITFDMAPGSILTLLGAELPGVIETSSGPGAGGVISILGPLAIISHGGVISALGESGGANVQINAQYFIASSDRLNVVQVDGTLAFSNAIYDVSSGTTDADLSMIDASGVLHGQCSTVRSTGQASQLNVPPMGPFGAADWPSLSAAPRTGDRAVGGCQ